MFLMPVRRILQLGDPTLRQASCPVRSSAGAAPILRDLCDTLHEFQRTDGFGRGISAIQIGHPLRIIYMEFEGLAYSLVNPCLDRLSDEKIRLWDNCFSFPDLLVYVERSLSVTLHYVDEKGSPHTLEAFGACAA
jgi:peptide deformylase